MIGKTNHLIAITLLFFTLLRIKMVMCGLHEYCDNCKTRAYNIICCYVEDQCCGIDIDNVGSYETPSQFLPTVTPFMNTTDSTTNGTIVGNQTVTSIPTGPKEANTNQFPITTLKIQTSNNGSSSAEDIRQTSSPIISSESMMTSNNGFTLSPNSTTSIRADVSISSTTATNLNVGSGNSSITNPTTNSVRTTKNVDFWSPSNNTKIPASNTTANTSNNNLPSALVGTTSNPSIEASTLPPATLELANVTLSTPTVNASTSTPRDVGIVTPSYVLNASTTQAKSGTSFNSLNTESINQSTTAKGYESSSEKIGNDSSLDVGVLPWRRTTKGNSEVISTIRENNLNETVSTSTQPSSEVSKFENTTTNQVSTNNITNGTTALHSSITPIAFSPNIENATNITSSPNTTHLPPTTNSSSPSSTTNSPITTNFSTAATASPSTPTNTSSLSTATTLITSNTSTVSMTESVWQNMAEAFDIGTNQDGRNGTSLLPNSTNAQSTTTSQNSNNPSPSSVPTSISPDTITTDINFLNLFSTTTKPQNKSNATELTGALNHTSTPNTENGTKTKPTTPTTVTNFSSSTSTSIPAVTAGKTSQLLGRVTLASISNLSTLKITRRPTQRITTKSFTQNITATPSVFTVVTQFTENSNYTTPTSRFNSTSNYNSLESGDEESSGDDVAAYSFSRKTTTNPSINPFTSDEYEAETSYEDATS